MGKSTKGYYAVAKGHDGFQGVVMTWTECEQLIKGCAGARYKKFPTLSQAERFAYSAPKSTRRARSRAKKLKSNVRKPKIKRPTTLALSLQSSSSSLAYLSPSAIPSSERITIYTDGACESNGTQRAMAGVGVYFGSSDRRNISEPLFGIKQTNQRAEMTAVIRALEIVNDDKRPPLHVVIKSDSNYTVRGYSDWLPNWKKNGWLTYSKQPVKNSDLWKQLDAALSYARRRSHVDLIWVKGHAGNPGNEAADRLAVAGILKTRSPY